MTGIAGLKCAGLRRASQDHNLSKVDISLSLWLSQKLSNGTFCPLHLLWPPTLGCRRSEQPEKLRKESIGILGREDLHWPWLDTSWWKEEIRACKVWKEIGQRRGQWRVFLGTLGTLKGAVVTCNSKESGALEKDPVPKHVNEAKRQKWFVPWPGDRREGQLERKSKDSRAGLQEESACTGSQAGRLTEAWVTREASHAVWVTE